MATKRQKEVSVGVRMPAELRDWAAKVASENDRTISWVVRSSMEYARLRDDGTVGKFRGTPPAVVRAKGGV